MVVTSERVPVAGGIDLRVIVRPGPSGPSVLLVHGLASNARLWDGVAESLERTGIGSVAVDLRGHGESDRPDGGFDFDTIGRDLGEVLRRFGGDGWVVAGQSWGGNVALHLATRRTDVTGLVLVDGGFIKLSEQFPDVEQALAALRPPDLVGVARSEVEQRMGAMLTDFPTAAIEGQLANFEAIDDHRVRPRLRLDSHLEIVRQLHDQDPDALAGQVDVPVRIVAVGAEGSRPRVTTFASHLRNGSVRWVDGHHDIHAQRPELVADVIRELL